MLNDKLRDTKLIYDIEKIEEKETFAFQLSWKKIDTPEGILDFLSPIDVKFEIEKNDEGFVIKGTVETSIKLICSRCLKEFEQKINGVIEAFYINDSLQDLYTKSEKLDSLDNIIFFSENKVDITDRIIESILMEIPEKPLCKEDCKGLCPVCGEDLNENLNHNHEEDYVDPRFSKLLEIFNDEK
ncbi:uncharacterized protein SAMN02745164_01297 [Marinitoga hydrogenitolerans DSM 16785]|uniref:DNA-binding protein n=1 Tax=Marinitoga hydrogenitolerans (strain DSM 16785 / JCM 12826 / AT1271) TaxID=1122195 RepID=A0A1M4X054_MARH1|nr:DUF177 domain-containing protein [Marinitoga hydrogenitolerans]SHE86572.1 uncharacterized protein SAMN02745164_01297 [Marinitoga hydrogenitolerans DSM 16785]